MSHFQPSYILKSFKQVPTQYYFIHLRKVLLKLQKLRKTARTLKERTMKWGLLKAWASAKENLKSKITISLLPAHLLLLLLIRARVKKWHLATLLKFLRENRGKSDSLPIVSTLILPIMQKACAITATTQRAEQTSQRNASIWTSQVMPKKMCRNCYFRQYNKIKGITAASKQIQKKWTKCPPYIKSLY